MKFIIRINQADNESVLNGISPKNRPPLSKSSVLPVVKVLTAKKDVIKAIRKTVVIETAGLTFLGTKGRATTPEQITIKYSLNRRTVIPLPA
ncbi:MAG: hypothetical protein U0T33_00710 [Bacteroidales bacterium]